MPPTIFVAQFTAAPTTESTVTMLACSGARGFTTRPTDTPPNKECPPFLMNGGSYDREMFSGNRTNGLVRASFGSTSLINNGYYDGMRNYGFSGREYTLYIGPEGGAFPADFEVVFTALMTGVTLTMRTLEITLHDDLTKLERPICQNTYSGAGGIDGDNGVKGKRRPRGYGLPFNYAPVLVDSTRLIYQCSDQGIDRVLTIAGFPPIWDGGAKVDSVIPDGLDEYTDVADMLANSPDPGTYRKYPPGGYFRLGSPPVFEIRTNNRMMFGGTRSRAPEVLAAIAADQGVTFNADDVTAASAAQPAEISYWNGGDDETALSAMSRISDSAGLWFGCDRFGELRMSLFKEPSGSPVYTVLDGTYLSIERRPTQAPSLPVYKVTVSCDRNWSPISTFAGIVEPHERARFSTNGNIEVATATAPEVLAKHPGAREMVVDTILAEREAEDAAERLLALYGGDRELIVVTLPFSTSLLSVDLDAVVEVKIARLGLAEGKLFRVIATRLNLSNSPRVEWTLWG